MDNINAIATIEFYEEKIKESEKIKTEETVKQVKLDMERAGEFFNAKCLTTNDIVRIHIDVIGAYDEKILDLQRIIHINTDEARKSRKLM